MFEALGGDKNILRFSSLKNSWDKNIFLRFAPGTLRETQRQEHIQVPALNIFLAQEDGFA